MLESGDSVVFGRGWGYNIAKSPVCDTKCVSELPSNEKNNPSSAPVFLKCAEKCGSENKPFVTSYRTIKLY